MAVLPDHVDVDTDINHLFPFSSPDGQPPESPSNAAWIQSRFVTAAIPGDGQVLKWDESEGMFIFSDDISGDATSLRGRDIETGIPLDGEILKWNDTAQEWQYGIDAGGAFEILTGTNEFSALQVGASNAVDGPDCFVAGRRNTIYETLGAGGTDFPTRRIWILGGGPDESGGTGYDGANFVGDVGGVYALDCVLVAGADNDVKPFTDGDGGYISVFGIQNDVSGALNHVFGGEHDVYGVGSFVAGVNDFLDDTIGVSVFGDYVDVDSIIGGFIVATGSGVDIHTGEKLFFGETADVDHVGMSFTFGRALGTTGDGDQTLLLGDNIDFGFDSTYLLSGGLPYSIVGGSVVRCYDSTETGVSFIWGTDLAVDDSPRSFIFGSNNTVKDSPRSIILGGTPETVPVPFANSVDGMLFGVNFIGWGNIIRDTINGGANGPVVGFSYWNDIDASGVFAMGSATVVNAGSSTIFFIGSNHDLSGLSQFTIGDGNVLAGGSNFGLGFSLDIQGIHNFIMGDSITNNALSNYNSLFGYGLDNTGGYNFAGGRDHVLAGDYNFAGGRNHDIEGNYNAFFGQDNISTLSYYCLLFGSNIIANESDLSLIGGQNYTARGVRSIITGINHTFTNTLFDGLAVGQTFEIGASGDILQSVMFGETQYIDHSHVFSFGKQIRSRMPYTFYQSSGNIAAVGPDLRGDAQLSVVPLLGETQNAGWTEMFITGLVGRLVVPAYGTFTFEITVQAASKTDLGRCRSWTMKCLVSRNAGGSVVMHGTDNKADIANSGLGGESGWDVQATADTTNQSLKVEVNGETGKNIYWNARVRIEELRTEG
jgi:hypothetical protein